MRDLTFHESIMNACYHYVIDYIHDIDYVQYFNSIDSNNNINSDFLHYTNTTSSALEYAKYYVCSLEEMFEAIGNVDVSKIKHIDKMKIYMKSNNNNNNNYDMFLAFDDESLSWVLCGHKNDNNNLMSNVHFFHQFPIRDALVYK